MPNLGDFLKSINKNKDPIMDKDDLAEKEYLPFVVNRTLSYFPDTVLYANEINALPFAENKLQFDFLRLVIRPRNRFSRWTKPEKDDKVDRIKAAYGYNNQRAREVTDLLGDEEMEIIMKSQEKGGK